MAKNDEDYHDFSNVEKQRNFMIPEEFPEGPVGSPINKDAPVTNKSTPWEEGMRTQSAFNYENKSLHEDRQRKFPGSHPPHDDPDSHNQAPYE